MESTNLLDELWSIFTLYSLLADPTNPEQLKVANFLRFAKDSQIISKKLTSTDVELELAKLIRDRRHNETLTLENKKQNYHYNTSFALDFQDFLNCIDHLGTCSIYRLLLYFVLLTHSFVAPKVYDKDPPDAAIRRLLLENVLFLSCRRVKDLLPLDDPLINEAFVLIKDTFGKSLYNIFTYYYLEAIKKRNITTLDTDNNTNDHVTASEKSSNKRRKEAISFKEYSSFCHDFGLKSTSLLTAIQVGEVFFTCVKLDYSTKKLKGMDFEAFCLAILHLGLVAYRDAHESIAPKHKIMGLLLYMWKKVNNKEKVTEIASSRQAISLSHAGSLNVHGSGMFGDVLLQIWIKDNFCDYITSPKNEKLQGKIALKSIINHNNSKKGEAEWYKDCIHRIEGTIDIHGNNIISNSRKEQSDAEDKANANEEKYLLSTQNINKLLTKRPDVTEFLCLEIRNLSSQ